MEKRKSVYVCSMCVRIGEIAGQALWKKARIHSHQTIYKHGVFDYLPTAPAWTPTLQISTKKREEKEKEKEKEKGERVDNKRRHRRGSERAKCGKASEEICENGPKMLREDVHINFDEHISGKLPNGDTRESHINERDNRIR